MVFLTMTRDLGEPSTRRVAFEFGLLMAGGLIAFGVQTLSEVAAGVLAIPIYVGFSLFLWRRGRVLAKLNRQINGAIFGGEGRRTLRGYLGLDFSHDGLAWAAFDPGGADLLGDRQSYLAVRKPRANDASLR
jgi:hypothetical protein